MKNPQIFTEVGSVCAGGIAKSKLSIFVRAIAASPETNPNAPRKKHIPEYGCEVRMPVSIKTILNRRRNTRGLPDLLYQHGILNTLEVPISRENLRAD